MLQHTRRAMTLVGIPQAEQDGIFASVAAVLHMGNTLFVPARDGGESCKLADDTASAHLGAAAHLLGVDAAGLLHALTTRTRQTHDGEPAAGRWGGCCAGLAERCSCLPGLSAGGARPRLLPG